MEVKGDLILAIAATIRNRRKDETFERALGKAIRRRHLSFSDYVEAISRIREMAREDNISMEEAAERIVSENSGNVRDDEKH